MIACSIYDIHIVAKKICGVSLQANLKVPKIPLVDYVTEFYGGLVGLKQKISHNVGREWSRIFLYREKPLTSCTESYM